MPRAKRPVLLCHDGSPDARDAIERSTSLLGEHDVVVEPRPPSHRAILKRAREHQVALIVVASRATNAVPPSPLTPISAAVVARAHIPVLIVHAQEAPEGGPILLCFDGSAQARVAIERAADLLIERDAIVASFLEPVDDVRLLQKTLPWPPPAETERRLARLDRDEAEFLTQKAAEGTAFASSCGLAARPLAVEGPGAAADRLLDAAAATEAACIVVGHRTTTTLGESTALALAHHTDRPLLVVPA
ncbi:MAG TPA: universal stress protein [Solirubrobacteraceae bacterium]|nr:universal stress protein [Solirubrobacteraceae bacterium]